MDVTVCIGTYGDPAWRRLAARAAQAAAAPGVQVVTVHGDTLASARNTAAARADGDLLVFCDADDQLADGYTAAVAAADGDLRVPRLRLIHPGGRVEQPDLTRRNIERINPCPIGTAIPRSMFTDLGGFREWPAWEDWCLFLRAARAGARIVHVPDAVYLAYVRPGSRNNTVADPVGLAAAIKAAA